MQLFALTGVYEALVCYHCCYCDLYVSYQNLQLMKLWFKGHWD